MRRFSSKVVYQKYVSKKLWKRLLVKNRKITVNCASTKNRVNTYGRFKKKFKALFIPVVIENLLCLTPSQTKRKFLYS